MFRRLGAGSGAPWRPWYDGGRHGDRELARLRCCVVVFCVSIVRKLLSTWQTCTSAGCQEGSQGTQKGILDLNKEGLHFANLFYIFE